MALFVPLYGQIARAARPRDYGLGISSQEALLDVGTTSVSPWRNIHRQFMAASFCWC